MFLKLKWHSYRCLFSIIKVILWKIRMLQRKIYGFLIVIGKTFEDCLKILQVHSQPHTLLRQDLGKKYIAKLLRNPSLSGVWRIFSLFQTVASLFVRYPKLGGKNHCKNPRLPGNHRTYLNTSGTTTVPVIQQGNFQGQCPPVSDGCGNEYETYFFCLFLKSLDWNLMKPSSYMSCSELWNLRNLCCNTRRIEDKGLKRVGRQSSNTEILTPVEDGSWRWFRLENFQVKD